MASTRFTSLFRVSAAIVSGVHEWSPRSVRRAGFEEPNRALEPSYGSIWSIDSLVCGREMGPRFPDSGNRARDATPKVTSTETFDPGVGGGVPHLLDQLPSDTSRFRFG